MYSSIERFIRSKRWPKDEFEIAFSILLEILASSSGWYFDVGDWGEGAASLRSSWYNVSGGR